MVLMTIVTLTLASCSELLNTLPFGNETTPQDAFLEEGTTTPEQVSPEVTTPEPVVTTPEPHEHTMGYWFVVKHATCVEEGLKERKCSGCDYVLSIPIEAHGNHVIGDWVITKEATCTSTGVKEKKCQNCDYTITLEIPVHNLTDWIVVTERECFARGLEERYCRDCDYTESQITAAYGQHVLAEWKITTEPTCTTKGEQTRICQRCDYKETKEIPYVHVWGDWNRIQEPTCVSSGLRERNCQMCGYTDTDVLSTNNHTWSEWVEIEDAGCLGEGVQERTCSVCGQHQTQNVTGTHTYTLTQWGICTVCGEIHENHEHIIKDGKCQYCDFVLTTTEVPSVFDNDGDGQNEVYLFAAALPEKFTADGVIYVDAVKDNLSDNIRDWDSYTADILVAGKVPYDHVYLEKGKDQHLLYTITVEEAGVYEMAIHLRLKDAVTRGATYTINEGTENEYIFQTSYGWETIDDAIAVRNNDKLIGTYMFGIYVELQAGENTIKITETELVKTQHFRDFYFVKVEE